MNETNENQDLQNETIDQAPDQEAQAQEPQPEKTPEECLQDELAQLSDKLMRTLAEYDNFRKRSARERETLYPEAENNVLIKLLPVLDNFERAAMAESTDPDYKKGMEMILTSFKEVLATLGVEPIGEEGENFDPNKHHAVMHIEDENLAENVVSQVLQKGYTRGGRILRFAMVQTAN